MRNFIVKPFDEYLVGNSNVYTPTSLAELLGSSDRICGLAVAHTSIGIGPTITLQFEHSLTVSYFRSIAPASRCNASRCLTARASSVRSS